MRRMHLGTIFVVTTRLLLLETLLIANLIESSRILIQSSKDNIRVKNENRNDDDDFIEKLIVSSDSDNNNNNNNHYMEADNRNSVFVFIDKLARVGVKTSCDASLLRSDLRDRIKNLKSIMSTCSLYCKVAVNNRDGSVYGSKNFNLECKLLDIRF
jgi:hypothetical protein